LEWVQKGPENCAKSGISNNPRRLRQNDCHDLLLLPNGTQRSQKDIESIAPYITNSLFFIFFAKR
jgi:hypothetical protein